MRAYRGQIVEKLVVGMEAMLLLRCDAGGADTRLKDAQDRAVQCAQVRSPVNHSNPILGHP
jgi:hypothetical protein